MIFYAAAALFLANFPLGVLERVGVVDTGSLRGLHHALFFAVFVSAVVAAGHAGDRDPDLLRRRGGVI